MAKETKEGLTIKKEDNFTEWFTQLMIKAELADYSSVSGCIIYRPAAYALWEKIRDACDEEFKKIGVQNSYFPMFIPENLFSKFGEHVKGFAPEVAWVTHGGKTKLGERLAVRPTSETIMYDSYSKWIRSYRDLPLLLNQWNNVVRWEFNNPIPFFRGREFLWNEMHTVFATEQEALEHGKKVMEAYGKITKDLMAIPAIYGRKTESEKFAGGVFSEKNHTYLPNGRVIEGTCFHHDGQNFAKAFNIKFQDKDESESYVWQNTHAISTRMLGTMLALHSDNNGVVIPPKIATNKIVIIPLFFKGKEKTVLEKSKELFDKLKTFEPIIDDRKELSAGRKFAEWELKGIPVRIEVGPKDVEAKEYIVKSRISEEKLKIKENDLEKSLEKIMGDMQNELYNRAEKLLLENMSETNNKEELTKLINEKKMVKVPLCKNPKYEESIKSEISGAKALFITDDKVTNEKCIYSREKADYFVYFGRTY